MSTQNELSQGQDPHVGRRFHAVQNIPLHPFILREAKGKNGPRQSGKMSPSRQAVITLFRVYQTLSDTASCIPVHPMPL
jgi:hypothetical protein